MQALYGIEDADIWRLATGLGAGLSRQQSVCGALLGGIAACGLVTGRQRASEHADRFALRDQTYARARQLTSRFQTRFGAIECGALVGCDFTTPAGRQRFKDLGLMKAVCTPAVRLVVEAIPEICAQ